MTIYDVLWRFMSMDWRDGNCHKRSQIVMTCRTLSWRLSQIVVTFFFPSPSRRPLLDFAESTGPGLFEFIYRRCPPSWIFFQFFELNTEAAFAKAAFDTLRENYDGSTTASLAVLFLVRNKELSAGSAKITETTEMMKTTRIQGVVFFLSFPFLSLNSFSL